MDRRSLILGLLAGGWIATVAATAPFSPFRMAVADPPITPTPPSGPTVTDPVSPNTPGRTINPLDGPTREHGTPNPGSGTSGANNHAIALAGSVGGGESVVYYFDTDNQRLLVYQFAPGNKGGIRLMAARHFDYDLKLEDYRDLSFKTRDELKAAYDSTFGKGSAGSPGKGEADLPVKKVEIPGGK